MARSAIACATACAPISAWRRNALAHRKYLHAITRLSRGVVWLQYEVTAMLWRVAARHGWTVRSFTATPTAPFADHVAAAAATGLLVSRHGALVANALWLPPGAATYELLPYNWEWQQTSQLYRNVTRSARVLGHFAWRPRDARWAAYESADDARFAPWTASECHSKCVAFSSVPGGLCTYRGINTSDSSSRYA